MFKKLTYKKRFIYLQVLIIAFLLIGYRFSIRKTLELRSEYKNTKEELLKLNNAPEQISNLKTKLEGIDQSVLSVYKKKQSVQDLLLEQIAEFCKTNNILIREFPKPVITDKDEFIIETNYIVLEGGFINLLVLLYNIEQKYKLGKVSSARFYRLINNKTKMQELYLEIYVQNIKSKEVDI